MDDRYLINCAGLAGTIGGDWPAGAYLTAYYPEANDGHGAAYWTADPGEALVFPDLEALFECYRAVPANRPVRPDGKPNRPLTMFAIEFVPVTADGHPDPGGGQTAVEMLRSSADR